MNKNSSRYEVVVDGKQGHFYFENDTSIPVAKEMLFQCLKFLGQVEDSIKAQIESKKQENSIEDSSVSESKIESIG